MDHKEIVQAFLDCGADHETARKLLGWFVEQRQFIDREGYRRGYDDGYHNALTKIKRDN